MTLLFLIFVLSTTYSQQFTIGTAKSTWFEASSWCHEQQPPLELFSIHSLTEYNAIKAIINQTDPYPHKYNYWTGLKHEGTDYNDVNTYSWSDGSAFDYGSDFGQPPWSANEPNSLDTPSCIRLGNTFKLLWDDVACNAILNGQKSVPICTETTVSPSNSPTKFPTNVPTQTPTINTQSPSNSPTTTIPTISPTAENAAVVDTATSMKPIYSTNKPSTAGNAGKIDLKMILIICAATLVCCIILVGFLLLKFTIQKRKKNKYQHAKVDVEMVPHLMIENVQTHSQDDVNNLLVGDDGNEYVQTANGVNVSHKLEASMELQSEIVIVDKTRKVTDGFVHEDGETYEEIAALQANEGGRDEKVVPLQVKTLQGNVAKDEFVVGSVGDAGVLTAGY